MTPSRTLAVALAVVALGALGASSPARANEHLERARVELAEIELEKAAASLGQALEAGDSGPSELAEIYLLGGQVAATLGDKAGALRQFKILLTLDPDARLVGVAPKIAAPFAEARRFARRRRALEIRYVVTASPRRGLVVEVVSDPMAMIAGAQATILASREVVRAGGGGPFTLPLPGDDRLELIASVHDRFGNQLAVLGTRQVPIVAEATAAVDTADPAVTAPDLDEGRPAPLVTRWYLWLGASAVAAGAGTYFGLAARRASADLDDLNRDSGEHDFTAAEAIEARWRRAALGANIGFGVAAGLGAVAAFFLVRDLARPDDPSESSISVLPTPGGAAASLRVSF